MRAAAMFLACVIMLSLLACHTTKVIEAPKQERRWGFYFSVNDTGLIQIHTYQKDSL